MHINKKYILLLAGLLLLFCSGIKAQQAYPERDSIESSFILGGFISQDIDQESQRQAALRAGGKLEVPLTRNISAHGFGFIQIRYRGDTLSDPLLRHRWKLKWESDNVSFSCGRLRGYRGIRLFRDNPRQESQKILPRETPLGVEGQWKNISALLFMEKRKLAFKVAYSLERGSDQLVLSSYYSALSCGIVAQYESKNIEALAYYNNRAYALMGIAQVGRHIQLSLEGLNYHDPEESDFMEGTVLYKLGLGKTNLAIGPSLRHEKKALLSSLSLRFARER